MKKTAERFLAVLILEAFVGVPIIMGLRAAAHRIGWKETMDQVVMFLTIFGMLFFAIQALLWAIYPLKDD